MDVDVDIDKLIPEGQLMSRWVIVTEGVDMETGEKQLFVHTTDGMESWDIEGFLRRAIRLMLSDEEDEDIDDS